jgi:sugar-specific transcriptional regulator TrmB
MLEELEENLISLGFTHNQSKVYISLLQLGQTKVGPLLGKTGFHRNIVYRALDDLIGKKLANKIVKRGVSYFSAIDPEPILLEQKRKEDTAKDILKEIKSIQKQSFSEVMILTGQQGIMDLCEMMIVEGADTYVIGATFNIVSAVGGNLERFEERVKKKGIKQYALAQAQIRGKAGLNFVDEVRFLPENFPSSPHVIWVFGQVTAHILWEEPQTIFIIKNQKVAESYRKYFDLLWKRAKKK